MQIAGSWPSAGPPPPWPPVYLPRPPGSAGRRDTAARYRCPPGPPHVASPSVQSRPPLQQLQRRQGVRGAAAKVPRQQDGHLPAGRRRSANRRACRARRAGRVGKAAQTEELRHRSALQFPEGRTKNLKLLSWEFVALSCDIMCFRYI